MGTPSCGAPKGDLKNSTDASRSSFNRTARPSKERDIGESARGKEQTQEFLGASKAPHWGEMESY